MKEITSLGNAVVKDVCNLKQKKYRERSGSFVVEGLRAVEEAVRYAAVQKLFAVPDTANTRLTQLLADAAAKNIELYSVTEQVMKKMSDTEAPQGVLAVCNKPQGFIVADGTVLVLDRVADPGNVGTLIRTAEAAGIAAVVLLAGCADAYAPKQCAPPWARFCACLLCAICRKLSLPAGRIKTITKLWLPALTAHKTCMRRILARARP